MVILYPKHSPFCDQSRFQLLYRRGHFFFLLQCRASTTDSKWPRILIVDWGWEKIVSPTYMVGANCYYVSGYQKEVECVVPATSSVNGSRGKSSANWRPPGGPCKTGLHIESFRNQGVSPVKPSFWLIWRTIDLAWQRKGVWYLDWVYCIFFQTLQTPFII